MLATSEASRRSTLHIDVQYTRPLSYPLRSSPATSHLCFLSCPIVSVLTELSWLLSFEFHRAVPLPSAGDWFLASTSTAGGAGVSERVKPADM